MVRRDDTPMVNAKDGIAIIRKKDIRRKDVKTVSNLSTTMSEKTDTYTKIVYTVACGAITVTANNPRTGKQVWLQTVWGQRHIGDDRTGRP